MWMPDDSCTISSDQDGRDTSAAGYAQHRCTHDGPTTLSDEEKILGILADILPQNH